MTNSVSLIFNQSNHLSGEIDIPGDKSITHRAIILGSLSNGKVNISNALLSEDCKRTLNAFRMLGVRILLNDQIISIYGNGLDSLSKPSTQIDAGNSGTLARLISGILAVQNFDSSITGDESLLQRPMRRIIDPLSDIGALINSNSGRLPLAFAKSTINPIEYN